MPSNRTSRNLSSHGAQRKSASGSAAGRDRDAVAFLTSQHREVEELFEQFEKLDDDAPPVEMEPIVRMACEKLTVHATIEEEIFYPAAREEADADSLLNEAEVEHSTAKNLIETLDLMDAEDAMFAATFTVLSEYIKHHVKEEEGELFPKLRKSGMELEELGRALAARAQELMGVQAEIEQGT